MIYVHIYNVTNTAVYTMYIYEYSKLQFLVAVKCWLQFCSEFLLKVYNYPITNICKWIYHFPSSKRIYKNGGCDVRILLNLLEELVYLVCGLQTQYVVWYWLGEVKKVINIIKIH